MPLNELRAREFMHTDVMTVTPDTSIIDIHKLFIEEEIHGAPVVDEDGRVRGVVSTLDLLRAVNEEIEPEAERRERFYYSDWWFVPEDLPARLREVRAADVMTREIVAVRPDTSVIEVARLMRTQRIHRVLVIANGVLIGVLTTFDLLRAFTEERTTLTTNVA